MDSRLPLSDFVRKALVVLGLAVLAFVVWKITYALLLAFGAVLFAVFLRGMADKVAAWTRLGMRSALAVVALGIVALLAAAGALIGPSIANQFDELSRTLIEGIGQVRQYLEQTGWGKQFLNALSNLQEQGGSLVGVAGKALISAVDAVFALLLVIVAGVYLAASPREYMEGTVWLFPKRRHARVREVLETTGNALWLWLGGQFVIMAVVGVLTSIGLLLIGVPLALALGLIAGMLEFIPFLGPILASVPIILVALTVDPMTALYAALVILAIQQIESNLLAPFVQRWAVALPPVLILIGTIASGLVFGVLGVIFAAPLMVLVMVWTKMLYMEDALDEPVQVPGEEPDAKRAPEMTLRRGRR